MDRSFSELEPEQMDLPSANPSELHRDLENLASINRTFGGTAAVLRLLDWFLGSRRDYLLMDLATGYGDHPRAMCVHASEQGARLRIVAVDFQATTLLLAREATPQPAAVHFVQADIRRLPFRDAAVDGALCTLALHHFGEKDAEYVLGEMRRVSREKTACLDLVRSSAAVWAIWLLTVLWMREPMTRHDARLSVRRAFSGLELKNLARRAGWVKFKHTYFPWFRQAIQEEKKHA